jgi:hypothetical protein
MVEWVEPVLWMMLGSSLTLIVLLFWSEYLDGE